MNEADTRRELIDPKLKEAGWGIIEKSLIRAAYKINNGESLDEPNIEIPKDLEFNEDGKQKK